MARNPILTGFNPDPSICRVDEDYYIATSAFEWYPCVQIHHSRDLVNWRLVSRPLNRAALLDLRGTPDSGGVWLLVSAMRMGASGLSIPMSAVWMGPSRTRIISSPHAKRSTASGPLHGMSIHLAWIPACFMTAMGGNGLSTCAGTIAAEAQGPIRPMTTLTGSSFSNGRRSAAFSGQGTTSMQEPIWA